MFLIREHPASGHMQSDSPPLTQSGAPTPLLIRSLFAALSRTSYGGDMHVDMGAD